MGEMPARVDYNGCLSFSLDISCKYLRRMFKPAIHLFFSEEHCRASTNIPGSRSEMAFKQPISAQDTLVSK